MHSVSLPDFVGRFPTPSTMDHIDRKQMRPSRAATNRKTGYLSEMIGNWPTPTPWEQQESIENWTERRERERAKGRNGNGFGIPLDMAARLWATPSVDDSKNNGSPSQQERRGSDLNVQLARMLPTPTALDSTGRANRAFNSGNWATSSLERQVMLLPTPSSGGDSGGPHGIRDGSWPTPRTSEIAAKHSMEQIRNRINQSGYHSNLEELVALETPAQGSLSPDWVSWLMGLPIKWTSLEPLPREEYLDWLHSQEDGTWWQIERGLPRVATGIKDRVNRLKCLGNGIVPASLALFLRGTT